MNLKKMKLRREFAISDDRKNRLQVISNGGGTQSCAMVVMVHAGLLPKPDLVLMANTMREGDHIFDYQKKYIQPLCDDIGLECVYVNKNEYTDNDITLSTNDDVVLPPFFTEYNGRDSNGDCSKQPSWCSAKWKTEVLQRYLNSRYGEKILTKRGVDWWIGMSLDEPKRVKYPTGKWQKRYPLFEAEILRSQAIQIVKDYNLPTPPRSACWMCPNRHDDEWQLMKVEHPCDFEKAKAFEKELQQDFPWLWLHKKGIPIGDVDFVESSRSSKQIDIFDQFCDSGMCFV